MKREGEKGGGQGGDERKKEWIVKIKRQRENCREQQKNIKSEQMR